MKTKLLGYSLISWPQCKSCLGILHTFNFVIFTFCRTLSLKVINSGSPQFRFTQLVSVV